MIERMDIAVTRASNAHAGTLLRDWRMARRLSQLDLALNVGVSARHLSYLETGKSQPSRDMLTRLADALDVPLRERNTMFVVAGFAPVYRESALTTPEMAPVRQAIDFILRQQEPYPAFVMNRRWDVLLVNDAVKRVFDRVKPGGPKHGNLMRQVFDPSDMRAVVGNWEVVAGDLIRHLHNEVAAVPSDVQLRALLDEVLAYPGVPAQWRTRELGAAPLPLLTTTLCGNGYEFRFLSTISTFGTTRDVTIDELRVECMFPVDAATVQLCGELAARA